MNCRRLLLPAAAALLLSASSAWAVDKTWTGATSTAWATAGNWTGGVPTNTDRAVIPAVVASGRMPLVSSNVSCQQLQVFGTLSISSTFTLTVLGNVSPAIDGTGSVVTAGTGLLTVTTGLNNGVVINDSITLGNFTLNSTVTGMSVPSNKTVTVVGTLTLNDANFNFGTAAGLPSTLDINGNLVINNNGALVMTSNNNIVRVSGSWTQSGIFTCGTGSTVLLDGAAAQVLTQTNNTVANCQFANLRVSTTGGTCTIAPNGNIATGFVVLDNFTLDAGTTTIVQEPCIIGTAAADTLGIGSGATITFQQRFDPDCTIAFDIDAGAQDGTLIMQGTTLPPADTSDFGFALRAGHGTVRIEVTTSQTFALTNGGPYSFWDLVINTDTGGNQVQADIITTTAAFTVLHDLYLTRCQFQMAAVTIDVFGSIFSGPNTQSQLDFTGAGTLAVRGNVDLGSVSQVVSGATGPFATIYMNGTTPQTFQIHATAASQYFDLDALRIGNPAGVTVLDNPNANFTVNGQLAIDAGARLTVQDVFDPVNPVVFAAGGGNVLRLENIIAAGPDPFGSNFVPATGTVMYAGQGVAQIVYAQNNGVQIPYYNLTIDNTGGVIATQETANSLRVDGTFTILGATSSFTGFTNGMTVGGSFISNGTFTHNNGPVTMTGTGSIGGTSASLTFNNLNISGSTAAQVVSAARSFTTAGTFQVTQGTLTTLGIASPITMTANLGMSVTGSANFNLVGPATLAVASGRTFSTAAATRFTTLANASGTPTITRTGATTFTATVAGTSNIMGLNFSFGDGPGLNLTGPIERLRNARFSNILAAANSRHLSISSAGADYDFPGCFFDTVPGGSFNVWALDTNTGNGVPLVIRFELRTAANTPTAIGGPGAGELRDGDDDANEDGVVAAGEVTVAHGGALILWPYTINIDMQTSATDVVRGVPLPAFDWNTFGFYSTYAVLHPSAGTDRLYTLDQNGDVKSFWPPAPIAGMGNIVGPPYFDTEAGVHVVYIGTDTGRVFKLVDTAGVLAFPASGPWTTVFTDPTLTKVSSFILSDQTNLYFGGVNNAGTDAIFKIQINPRTMPNTAIPSLSQPVTGSPSWYDSTVGRRLYIASNPAAGASNVYRVDTAGWTIDSTYAGGSPFAPTSLPNITLFAGDAAGFMNAFPANGTAAQFSAQQAGFAFRDAAGVNQAIRGGAGWDSLTNRLIFGNAAGNVYTMNYNAYAGGWVLNTNYFMTGTSATAIASMPLVQDGVIYVTNTAGRLFLIDAFRGPAASPKQALFYTWNFGNPAMSDLSRDADAASGRIYVSTGNGKLYAITTMTDPTAAFP